MPDKSSGISRRTLITTATSATSAIAAGSLITHADLEDYFGADEHEFEALGAENHGYAGRHGLATI